MNFQSAACRTARVVDQSITRKSSARDAAVKRSPTVKRRISHFPDRCWDSARTPVKTDTFLAFRQPPRQATLFCMSVSSVEMPPPDLALTEDAIIESPQLAARALLVLQTAMLLMLTSVVA